MRSLFLITFCLVISAPIVVAQIDINKFDSQGNRNGVWKKYYPGTKQLRYEGTFKNGKEVGIFKFYCEKCNDKPTAIKEFNEQDDIATVKYYTIKGKLVSEGRMDGKERIGEWIYYHEKSNNIMSREHYIDGKLDGKKTTYYTNNKITEELHYKGGMKNGENNYFSPDGVLIKKLKYRNNELQGEAFYYDAYGAVIIEGSYKDDKKHGLWRYYKDGNLVLEETYPKPLKKEK